MSEHFYEILGFKFYFRSVNNYRGEFRQLNIILTLLVLLTKKSEINRKIPRNSKKIQEMRNNFD